MSLSDINDKLKFFKRLLEERSKSSSKLCELLGRLDFMEKQMDILKEKDDNTYEPIIHYKESIEEINENEDIENEEIENIDFNDVFLLLFYRMMMICNNILLIIIFSLKVILIENNYL